MTAKPCLNVRKKPSHIVVDDPRILEKTNVTAEISDNNRLNPVTFKADKHGESKNSRITIKLHGKRQSKDVTPPDAVLQITLTDTSDGNITVPMEVAYVDDPNDRKKPRPKPKPPKKPAKRPRLK